MIEEKIPKENLSKYFDHLIDKTYKILPLKEEGAETLTSYLESFLCELLGNKGLNICLCDDPKYITVINTIQYLITENYSIATCKKEVFKCIHILEDKKVKHFKAGDLHG